MKSRLHETCGSFFSCYGFYVCQPVFEVKPGGFWGRISERLFRFPEFLQWLSIMITLFFDQ
jgi:hypothetical protein